MIFGIIALIITDILGLFTPWFIKCAIDALRNIETTEVLIKYGSLIIGVVAIQGIFRFYWRKYLFGLSRKIEYELRNDYFRHIQRLSASFFLRMKTGDLMSRATNDLGAVREFIGLGSLIMVDSLVTVSTSLALMFVINIHLTLMALAPMMLVSLLVIKFGRLLRKRFTDVQAQLSKISSFVQENISGIRVVQAYVREENEKKRFASLNEEYIAKNISMVKVSGVLFPLLTLISGIAAAIVLWLGGRDVIVGKMTLGSFVAFNGYLAMLTWPMMAIGFMINLMQRGSAAMTRIEEILNTKPEIQDMPTINNDMSNQINIKGDIEFNDLSFSYPCASQYAISNINLKIKAGSTIAIVGPVGSGKSTIGRLLARFYDVSSGQITIDGIDIKMIPLHILRKNVCYVEQDPFLFANTIYENIAFGYNDGQLNTRDRDQGSGVSDQGSESSDNDGELLNNTKDIKNRIWDVAIMAGMEKDIISFPDKIDTRIGERGVTLSGGQKQRIALARGLIKSAKILILDDTFSSLDMKTEKEIFGKIANKLKDSTTILISHRISTVKDADVIVVLNNGKIVEMGTHQELIDKCGVYYKIYKHQMLDMDMDLIY